MQQFIDWLSQHPAQVRGVGLLVATALAVLAAYAARQTVRTLRVHRTGSFTLAMSARMLGWIFGAVSLLVTLGFVLIGAGEPNTGPFAGLRADRAIDFILPVLAGMQAALILSPDEEPLLELHLTYRRPFVWLAAERLMIVLIVQSAIGLVGTLLAVMLKGGDPAATVLRWLPPLLLMAGIGLRVTLATGQIVFGTAVALAFSIGIRAYGDGLVAGYTFLWPVHPYLQPFSSIYFLPGMQPCTDYAINRLLISLLGVGLMVSGLNTLRNEERLMLGIHAGKAG